MSGDPMDRRRCTALAKSTRERCKRRPIPGGTVCVKHGGASPQVRAAAERRKDAAKAEAVVDSIWRKDVAPVTAPVEELARLLGQLRHAVDVLGGRVEDEDLDGATALAWSRVMREYRLALDGAARLGLEERQVRINEQTAHLLAGVVRRVLDQLELTPEQMILAGVVVPAEFRLLATGQVVAGEVE